MHDWLFENQGTWQGEQDAADEFRTQALALGADGAKYDACIADPKTQAKVEKDMKDGAALGVRGTPAFFLYKMQDGKEVGQPNASLRCAALPAVQLRLSTILAAVVRLWR